MTPKITTHFATITTSQQLTTQIEELIQIAPSFATIYKQTRLPDIRQREGDFKHLCSVIVSQQLSVAAATTIWQRLNSSVLIDEANVLATIDETYRECGLSKQKIRYIKSLAEHHIDFESLITLEDDRVIKTLTAVTGIGNWTAEIYCLFSLNRTDVFAHNDLALQVAAQDMLSLAKRPNEREMKNIATAWSPHRSAAAYLLWKYYAVLKGHEGIVVP